MMTFLTWFERNKHLYPKLSWQDFQLLWRVAGTNMSLLQELCEQAQAGKPLEYLLKRAYFGPLELTIQEPLLIPRPETWDWIESFLPTVNPKHVLDLGCGPGTLGLGLSYFHPKSPSLTAIDIHPIALEVARLNLRADAFTQLTILKSDWFESLQAREQFDLIMSNPPYCAEEERSWMQTAFEDPSALFAPQGGLAAYHSIFSKIADYLTTDGIGIVEHGCSQGGAILRLLECFKLKKPQPWYDKMGRWRATSFKKS